MKVRGEILIAALIPPLNRATPCAKCGSKTEAGMAFVHVAHGGGFVEAIKRTCRDCGYEWFEAPLDAPKAAGPMETK